MREIKFRVWDKNIPTFSEAMEDKEPTGQMVTWEYAKESSYFLDAIDGKYPIMQYTGLKDKQGIEIYEGDIVVQDGYKWFIGSMPNYVGTIEFIYSQWQVVAHSVSDNNRGYSDGINEGFNDSGIDDGNNSEWVVIGNIYEHPHLLGETK